MTWAPGTGNLWAGTSSDDEYAIHNPSSATSYDSRCCKARIGLESDTAAWISPFLALDCMLKWLQMLNRLLKHPLESSLGDQMSG